MAQFIPQTPRDFLASLTPPLAIPNSPGRFGKAGVEALAKARQDGFLFIGDPGHPDTEAPKVKAPKAEKPAVVKAEGDVAPKPTTVVVPKQATPAVDPKEVRAWAKANGHEVGDRGRIHGNVVTAFLAAGGKAVGPKAPEAKAPKPVKVRSQQIAWGRIPRRKSDPKFFTEPILGIKQCGACRKGVSYCPCEGGPRLPKHYGSGPTVLTLAAVPSLAVAVTEVTA